MNATQPKTPLNPAEIDPAASHTVTARALLVGIFCVAITCVLVTWAELVISTIRIGYLQLPPVSIALVILVIALTRGMSNLFKRRWNFTSAELATVYIMTLVGAMISSHGMVQKLMPLLVAGNYFATDQNQWQKIFGSHIPHWLVPYNPQGAPHQPISVGYYEHLAKGESIPWQPWVIPLLVWGLMFALMFAAFLCLTALLRRQWSENERLAFPLAQLPLEIIGREGEPSFFSNPKVWMGAAIPVFIYTVDWLHQLYPTVPSITTSVLLNDYLPNAPWNQMAYTPLVCSFAALGFFYLLPVDILFSLWFFFMLTRIEQIIGISVNMDMPHMPTSWLPVFEGYQIIGAYVVLLGYFIKMARPHLKKVWATAIGKMAEADGQNDLLSYRAAFWGLIGSVTAACLLMCLMGMSPCLAVLELVCIIFVIGLVMARSTAEAGLLMTETTFQPYDLYHMFGSMHNLGGTNLTLLAFIDHLFTHDQRGLLLTGMLDSARVGDGVHLARRSLTKIIVIGIVCAAAIAVPLQLVLGYKIGALKMDSWMMQGSPLVQFRVNSAFLQNDQSSNGSSWQMPVFFAVGMVVTLCLTALRSRFFWWPLHPLGYALAGSQSTIEFWFPCLIAWGLKSLTLRYGGMGLYQAARPFFLGLILGEFGMAVLSALMNILFQVPPPPFPWI